MECSPPRKTGNFPRVMISPATRRNSATTSSIVANGNSISGSVQMPMLWTSVCVSSSQSSMCEEATRISCGPVRVPGTYDVVRSNGIGRITTRARSKSTIVGVVPPKSPTAMLSYSKGSFDIDVLEEGVVGGHGGAHAFELALSDDVVDLRPQRDVRHLLEDRALRLGVGFLAPVFVCLERGAIEQRVDAWIHEMSTIEPVRRHLLGVKHATQDVRIGHRAADPLQRVELEVAREHVLIQRREFVGADVEIDADRAQVLLNHRRLKPRALEVLRLQRQAPGDR